MLDGRRSWFKLDRTHRKPSAVLRRVTILALGLIAALALVEQAFVQSGLNERAQLGQVVNVAGRQRMLSERLVREVLSKEAGRLSTLAELEAAYDGVRRRDRRLGLLGVNSPEAEQMLSTLERPLRRLREATTNASKMAEIVPAQVEFLAGVEALIAHYEAEADSGIGTMRRNAFLVLAFAFALLIGEIFLIFRPAGDLMDSLFRELERHRDSLEVLVVERTAALKQEAEQKAEALSRLALANQQLEEISRRDALTGLSNRRHFDENLKLEWLRGAREKASLCLLVVDVDHFKKYNDALGHPQGDQCLRAIAKGLASAVTRAGDVVARLGGEEFAILLPNTSGAGGKTVAERLRERIEALAIPHPGSPVASNVTVSVGVAAVIPRRDAAETQLMLDADAALYLAKGLGRNCVAVSPSALSLPPICA